MLIVGGNHLTNPKGGDPVLQALQMKIAQVRLRVKRCCDSVDCVPRPSVWVVKGLKFQTLGGFRYEQCTSKFGDLLCRSPEDEDDGRIFIFFWR